MPENSCTIVPPGQGEAYWIVGDHVVFKLGAEQTRGAFAFAETTVAPGGGPPPHIHHREDETFYILDGQFTLVFGDQTLSGSTGDSFYLPKGIVHTFKNIGTKPGRLLVGATPSGFEKFIPEAGCPCTDARQPAPAVDDAAIGKLMTACGRYGLEMKLDYKPGPPAPPRPADREFWVLGLHVRLKLTSENTLGKFSVAEVTARPGDAVPPHLHHDMDEIFYVLEGTFEFNLEGRPVTAPAGTFVHVPPMTMHGFRNIGKTPARLVDYHTPGGFEKFFEECGVSCAEHKTPPQGPIEPARIIPIFERHRMTLAPLPNRSEPQA